MTDFKLLLGLANDIIQTSHLCLSNGLRDRGLGSAEANVLMFLYTNGDTIRQDDIVEGVAVSKPAISRTIAALEHKGYIERERSAHDRRSYVVRLTDRAHQERMEIQQQFVAIVEAAKANIPVENTREFLRTLQLVADNLREHRKVSLGR